MQFASLRHTGVGQHNNNGTKKISNELHKANVAAHQSEKKNINLFLNSTVKPPVLQPHLKEQAIFPGVYVPVNVSQDTV